MFKIFKKSVREYKLPTILTLIFIVCEIFIEVLIPFITADLINTVKNGADLAEIRKSGVTLVTMACVSLFFGGAAGFTSARAATGFGKNLRHDLFAKIQTFSFANIDKFSSASLVTRMTTDVFYAQTSYMMLIRIAVRAPLMFIFSIVMAYVMGGSLATMFVIVIPVLIFGLLLITKKAMPAFRAVFKKYDKLNESVEENVRGMRVVKSFARESFEKEKFRRASEDIRSDFTRAERIVAFNNPLMQSCLYFNMIFVLIFGSKLIISMKGSVIDVGQMSTMLTYGFQILISLMMISMVYVTLTISAESMRRITEVLTEEPTIKNPEFPVNEVLDGSVDFKDVSFKYSEDAENFSLKNINLHIDSGMTVGILGGTGSSKSSLIQLISRLYDTTVGEVDVGGIDVKKYDLDALRSSVSVVLQKNLLFSGTIMDNLKWGNENATYDEVSEACKLACAEEFILSFPDRYNTWIEQGGANVSGGQKQRLCIARALLKKPKILILDDSTSAVDMKTDALIRKGFKEYIPETTKIIIAQRVASVMDSDLIIVMDGGQISAMGKHDELLKTSQIYAEVYEQQMGGDENE